MHDTRRCIIYFMGGLGALLVVTPALFVCRRKTSKSNKSARTRPVYTRCRGAAADLRSNVYSVEVLPSLIPPPPPKKCINCCNSAQFKSLKEIGEPRWGGDRLCQGGKEDSQNLDGEEQNIKGGAHVKM